MSREEYEKQLKVIVDQLPLGLLHRLIKDAQYFLDWYHSKKNRAENGAAKSLSNVLTDD